jgi:aminomethyltransferase
VGVITSGAPSPTLSRPIAMAYVQTANAADTHFQIDIRGSIIGAQPTSLPFYRRPKL